MKHIYIILIIILGLSIQSFAQSDSINYDSLAVMPLKDILQLKVEGVSKYEEATDKSPASVIIITESQIRENCYQDLSDVLKNVLGIDIVDNARGFGEYYTVRGVEGNDRFLVTIDGQKINPVSGTFLSVGNSISVNFAQRIEIIYGPSSVMYGADAFAGIINIVSKDVINNYYISSNIDYGSLNTKNGEISAQFKINDNLSISAFARILKSDGVDFVGRDSVYNLITQYHYPQRNEFEQPIDDHTIFAKAKYKNLTLSFFQQHFNEGNALGQRPISVIYNKECKWEMNNNVFWLNYNNKIGEKSNISFDLAYVNHQQDPETQFYKWDNGSILEKSFSQYLTGIDNSLKSSVTFNRTFFKQKNLKLISGVEYEYTHSIPPYANDQVLASSDKFEGEVAEIIKKELTIIEQRFAGFTQIDYSPVKFINIILGGRYDYSILNKGTFNPRMSFVLSPNKKSTLKLIYGTAFQAPSLFYQYEQWGSVTAVMLSANEIRNTEPNWRLKNQKISTIDIQISRKIGDFMMFYLSAYHSSLTDIIERVVYTDSAYNKYFSTPDTAYYSLGIRNENIGIQKIHGVNFKAEISLKPDFYAYLSYSFTDAYAETVNGKEYIPRIAKHKFWAGFIYRNLFNHINISTRIKWIGDVYNRNKIAFPTGKQRGYFNMDLSLRFVDIVKPIVFYVRMENVFDTDYYHAGIFDQTIHLPTIPQNGFTIRAGVEVSFYK